VMQGAEDAFGPGSISVFLCDGRGDRIREQHYLRTLLERRVDGIIVTGKRQDLRDPIGLNLPVPVVYVMTHSSDPGDLSLIPDEEQGAELAVRHLLSTGRSSIGHITGPDTFAAARLRSAATEKVLAEAGLPLAGGTVMFGQWSEEWGRQAAAMLLRTAPGLDAIFCGNDQVARGAADIVRESGRRIPEDVALVGFRPRQPDRRGHEPAPARPRGGPAATGRDRRPPRQRTAQAPLFAGATRVHPPHPHQLSICSA
jgi:LacI family transcriptional regulator